MTALAEHRKVAGSTTMAAMAAMADQLTLDENIFQAGTSGCHAVYNPDNRHTHLHISTVSKAASEDYSPKARVNMRRRQ